MTTSYPFGAELCGHPSLNNPSKPVDLVFPVEAYAAALQWLGLPLPPEWSHLQPEAFGDGLEVLTSETEAPSETRSETGDAPSDAFEVVPGITLGDLKALLDERHKGETFRPLLLAAVKSAIELDRLGSEVPEGKSFTIFHGKKREEFIKEQLEALNCFNPNRKDKVVSSTDIDRVSDVLRLTPKAQPGNPHRT